MKIRTIIYALIALMLLVGLVTAYETVYNPFTSKLDYVQDFTGDVAMDGSLQIDGNLTVNGTSAIVNGQQVLLANSSAGGDASGTLSALVIGDDSHLHDADNLTGLDALDDSHLHDADNLTGLDALDDSHLHNAANITSEIWVDVAGDSMSGDLNMSDNDLHNVTCIYFASGGQMCSG